MTNLQSVQLIDVLEFPVDRHRKDCIMSGSSLVKSFILQQQQQQRPGSWYMGRQRTMRRHVACSKSYDGESSFFYDEHKDDAINRNILDHWREFRALLVATEQQRMGGEGAHLDVRRPWGHPTKEDDLKRILKINHVSGSLSKHVRESSDEDLTDLKSLSHKNLLHWSHAITHPERGCLLVARMPDLGMFSYSVILMTEHDDEVGSSGLVLNMSTPLHVANLGLEEHINASLGKSPLYIGGPVTRNLLHVLHGCPEVEGSMEIIPGVYAGGVESAAELVLQGRIDPSEFRLLAGYSGWEPYQLSEEIRQGAWHVISASSDVILGCIKGDYTGFGDDQFVSDSIEMADGDISKLHCWKAILSETGLIGF